MSRSNTISRSAYNRAYLAKRRAELKAAGLCQWCGKAPAKPSPRGKGLGCRCAECASLSASKSRASMARKRPAWNALGICSQCGTRQAMPRTHICGVCAERRSEYQADHRKVPLLPRDPTLETESCCAPTGTNL